MKPKAKPMKPKVKRSHHKKIVKVVADVKTPVLLVPMDFPKVTEPIVLVPSLDVLDDPNWIKRAWRWIVE